MTDKKKTPVRVVLTEEQRKQIQSETGRDAEAVEFNVEELEERIAPARIAAGVHRFSWCLTRIRSPKEE